MRDVRIASKIRRQADKGRERESEGKRRRQARGREKEPEKRGKQE